LTWDREIILNAALGLTTIEVENAFALSVEVNEVFIWVGDRVQPIEVNSNSPVLNTETAVGN
jgi:hypothetical protein